MKLRAHLHRFIPGSPLSCGPLPVLQTHSSPGLVQQRSTCHPKNGKCRQRDQLRRVLGQAFVAKLGKSELTLENPERVFYLGLVHPRVTQAKPLLQKEAAQRGLHSKRRASALVARTRRKGCNQRHQLCPRDHPIHLVEKHALARALTYKLKSGGGEADLFHKFITFRNLQALVGFCRDSLAKTAI